MAALGAWLVFEDEAGFSMTPPTSGRLEATETFRFDSAGLRNPLREAVLESGWTWRGVLFGML